MSMKYYIFIHNCNSIAIIYVKLISYLNTAVPKDFRKVAIRRLKDKRHCHFMPLKKIAAPVNSSSA